MRKLLLALALALGLPLAGHAPAEARSSLGCTAWVGATIGVGYCSYGYTRYQTIVWCYHIDGAYKGVTVGYGPIVGNRVLSTAKCPGGLLYRAHHAETRRVTW